MFCLFMPHRLEDYCFVRLQGFHLIFSSECPIWHSPYTQETRVQSLDREYPLEKATATHSSIPAWRIPWTEETGKNRYDYKLMLISVRWKLNKYLEKTKQKKKKKNRVSLVTQTVKNLPAMPETWVHSLGREYPLKEETATHSSTLAGRIPWTEEPDGLQSTGSHGVRQDWVTIPTELVSLRSFMNNVALWWPEIFRLASWMCKRYTYITVYLKITSKF